MGILQNKINLVNEKIDLINENHAKADLLELNNLIKSMQYDLGLCRDKAKLISMN